MNITKFICRMPDFITLFSSDCKQQREENSDDEIGWGELADGPFLLAKYNEVAADKVITEKSPYQQRGKKNYNSETIKITTAKQADSPDYLFDIIK